MPRLTKEERALIKSLSQKDLQEIVLKMAAKEKSVYDFVWLNYLDREYGEQDLFEQAKADIKVLFRKSYRGFSEQLQLANMLAACIKRLNQFTKVSGNKVMEAELLMFILEPVFALPSGYFGTCFTKFDTKVAMILKRLITIVTKKLHEDYKIEYEDKINEYLDRLHDTSDHIDMIYAMPKSI